jgi:hypothetical protein
MLFHKIALLASTLSVGCLAVRPVALTHKTPSNHKIQAQADHLVDRQDDGSIIFTTICLGPRCSDAPEPTPTSTKKTTLKTTTSTKKTTSATKTATKVSCLVLLSYICRRRRKSGESVSF